MDDELLEPLEGYKVYYKDKFKEIAKEYFDELKEKSKVDVEANKETNKILKEKKTELEEAKKKLNGSKGVNTFLTILLIVGIVLGAGAIFLIANEGFSVGKLVVSIVGLLAAIISLIIKLKVMRNKLHNLQARVNIKVNECNELINEAKKQMAPLNALFDWNIPVILTRKTIPTLELDQYFDAKKFVYLNKKYGLNNDDKNRSTVYCQSGSVLGNPFLICKDYITSMVKKTYSNSITIHWTTTVHTKNGTRTVHHTQTLTAYVYAPAPSYRYSTYLVYGNEAAPHLSFLRFPTDVENMTDKQIEKFVKTEVKKLNKKETKALTDNNPNTNYSRFGNDEFEAIFGGTDRDNEVEYNLLFTPLAQANILKLLKDKEKIAYGDDFMFEKRKCLNYVKSAHSQAIDYSAKPTNFMGYDIEDMEEFFIEYNSEWFKSFYFDLAPILSIPLYQTHKSKEFIYKEDILANLSTYEYEVMANGFDPSLLSHEDACTPNIYKTQFVKSKGNTDEFNVTAYAYRGERRVTYVTKWGGDGHSHVIPVHWIEYFPVEKETLMSINKNNQSRYDYNNTDHPKLSNLNTHFERGLLGILGYQAMFDADEAVASTVVKEEGFNLEKTIADLERELDELDKKQESDSEGYMPTDDKLSGEEKEVSTNDIETGSDSDDDSDDEIDE